MALLMTPVDVAAFANQWQLQATGKTANLTTADTTSLTSVGETIMRTGVENTINSLYILLGNLYVNVKKYNRKARIVRAINPGVYTSRLAMLSVFSKRAIASGYWNTDVMPQNFAPGATNGQTLDPVTGNPVSTKSMWEQNPAVVMETFYEGRKVLDFEAPTIYLDKLEQAFRGVSEFMSFVNACELEFRNDMTQYEENFDREQLVSAMAQDIDMEADRPESVIHAVSEFNRKFRTSYTADELTSTYSRDFYSFLAARLKNLMDRMEERSVLFHWNPTKTINGETYDLLRFVDRTSLKWAVYAPTFNDLETYVLPEVFHTEDLKIDLGKFEKFTYWQNINVPDSIDIIPAVNDTDPTSATYGQQITGDRVQAKPLMYIFDERRILTTSEFKRALSSPVEARKGYYNVFHHWSFNHVSDATCPSCVILLD